MKFVVMGGGSAGWITALFVRKIFPHADITLVHNDTIGIIGVGEATTPNIVTYLRSVDIDPYDLIKETKGAIKSGIKFENWHGDGSFYFHSFNDNFTDFSIPDVFSHTCLDFYLKNLIKRKLPLTEYIYNNKLALENKVDLDRTWWAIHFDTNLFGKYLAKVGASRNIKTIEGKFKNVELKENGFIKTIHLEDGKELETDFVFDCSGFARLLIGKLYNTEWVSFAKHLPMKKGIPFWLDPDEEIEPYTSAIAMKYGWMWKIPLQHRFGSGYIFDSDYIDENQALEEAEAYYGRKLSVNRIIPFEAGRFKKYWVKNCISVGLASSFIEPLESTSIFLSIGQLDVLRQFLNELQNPNETSIDLYNEIVGNNMEDTLNFVYLHYLTKRKDSEFWRTFRDKYPPPSKLEKLLPLITNSNLRYYNTSDTKTPISFGLDSFLQVASGLELFEKEFNLNGYENIVPSPSEYKRTIDSFVKDAITHRKFLESL